MKVFRFIGLSDQGLVRSANQDAYHIDADGRFVIVADGMGGHTGGEQASRVATQVIQDYLVKHWDSVEPNSALLEGAFFHANQAIVQEQQNHPERAEMGTTAVVVIFRKRQPWVAHIGDSRLYRLRSSNLEQITEDHTWVAKAFKFGDITLEEVKSHPYRHMLSSCLGREELHKIDVQQLDIQSGDRLLLCSDGLTEELSDHLITSHIQSNPSVDRAVVALVKAALANGGRDNITVVIVAIDNLKPSN